MEKKNRFSFGMFLVTIGIVYGDIGTSPLYVMKSIMEGNGGITGIDQTFIMPIFQNQAVPAAIQYFGCICGHLFF